MIPTKKAEKILVKSARAALSFYQKAISPHLGNRCRFVPTCSEYCKEALESFGLIGLAKVAKRILKCHPFHSGGHDPVGL